VEAKPGEVTQLLARLRRGDKAAEEKLVPLIYGELRRLAGNYFRGERPGHTLQPTALVHEAYLRLSDLKEIDWQNSGHFFAIAAQMMRRILIDHARSHRSEKRGGGWHAVELETVSIGSAQPFDHLLALDEALERLSHLDPRQARIVELKFFGGLTEEQVAIALGVSTRTVKRDWRLAKAWLYQELNIQKAN
jgi:RNA polymerase sigma factor (TIGR02999 family)